MNNFKLAHMSDAHLGYKSTRLVNKMGVNLREADGYVAFKTCVDEIIQEECDAVVFCGDTFHSPTPDIRAIVFAQEQLRRFADAGIPVYLLAGNHDTNDIRADIAASKVLDDPYRKIYSHVEPWVPHEIGDGINLHLVSHHMYGEQAETMSQIKPVEGAINIFSTHGSVIDPILQMKLHAEQSPREIVIPDALMEDHEWNAILLGHIHERGWVGSTDGVSDTLGKNVYYNGSTLRRGYSDKEVKLGRGWTLWDIAPDGTFTPTYKTVAQRPQYDFEIIDAKDLTSGQVTEIIINNLQSTQLNGTEFDPTVAPMLRQRIKNLSPSKHAGLDLKSIDQQSKHAFQWAIKTLTIADTLVEEDCHGHKTITALSDGTDAVKLYDEWASTSAVMQEIDKDILDTVKTQSRDFIQAGQEAVLESE